MSAASPLRVTVQRASRASHIPSDAKLRRWARAAAAAGEVTLRYVAEAEARRANREFRGRDYATNVLSFPYGAPGRPAQGDILVCAPVVAREAREQGKEVEAHHAHLVVHGVLHLRGYDHERGAADARRMESLERRILAKLGFPDPY
ncbi:MAG TPA: rRNA maturation RNase YbeY [Usitatibacter sp.]|nr:rRNA maturation RNase YbeY [Usitatibacter sp.]